MIVLNNLASFTAIRITLALVRSSFSGQLDAELRDAQAPACCRAWGSAKKTFPLPKRRFLG
jgi:hypothetical protein